MGLPPRKTHHNPPRPLRREVQVSRLPPHDPIDLCPPDRLHLPPHPNPHQPTATSDLPLLSDHPAPAPGRFYIRPRRPLRLRLPRAHRLHHLHPREIMQASARDVPAHHHLPETLPLIQVPRCCRGDGGRRCIHAAFGQEAQDEQELDGTDGVGTVAAWD